MTVSVKQHPTGLIGKLEIQRACIGLASEKIFQQQTLSREHLRLCTRTQTRVFFLQRKQATRLTADDRDSLFSIRGKQSDIVLGQCSCAIEHSLRYERSAAAFALLNEDDLKAGGLEQFSCGDADLRLVVAHERVMKHDHPFAVVPQSHAALEPL